MHRRRDEPGRGLVAKDDPPTRRIRLGQGLRDLRSDIDVTGLEGVESRVVR